MRFHVIGVPQTQVNRDFSTCAFTQKVLRFCNFMTDLGHEVILYAGENSDTKAQEQVVCFSEARRAEMVGDDHYTSVASMPNQEFWSEFTSNVISALRDRVGPKDFLCLIAGYSHKLIAEAFPANMSVEFGIGYKGSFSPYRVFESYAWMHTIYALEQSDQVIKGNFYHTVIPGYLEQELFPYQEKPEDYFLYLGRMTPLKGIDIAAEVCQELGLRLLLAGPGKPPEYGEYLGEVGPEERAKLLGGAIATFVPTIYVEPFGNVAIESQTCGTPTITSDWGAFTETNVHGFTGFRCHTMAEFMQATIDVRSLDRKAIHENAVSKYSIDVIALQYERYFERLMTLWGDGWYTGSKRKRPGFKS
jgi:glycosyltransferase involved in cell wall biosynthesis